LQDREGNIWFSNWNGAYRYDGKSFTKIDGLSNGPVTRIIEDKKGNLWFGGGYRGICRYDSGRVGQTFTCFTTKDGLINNDVWSILEDKSGNFWIGTRGTGLYRYDPRRAVGKTFTNFSE
jgi:ligand-binding sensor domain-containing protein